MDINRYEKKHNSATIKGKLRVCKYLTSHMPLKYHVPHTVLFTLPNLKYMSQKYKSVYIKLDVGSMGIGVYKMKRIPGGYRLYSTDKTKQKSFNTISKLYKHLKAKQPQKMIIQKNVLLDRVNGRPYDIRAMVQRRPGNAWTCTGFLIKVGNPKKIVTNYHQGGKLYTLEKLLKLKKLSPSIRRFITQNLTQKALTIANVLSSKRSGMYEMGVDFAYDRSGHLWILEVNSNYPEFRPIKRLDRAAYRRMKSFANSYGRP